ncbi:SDR family NAD(P)-dependent oxidoreductase, partial [Hydrogenophaga sp.]|uniref:SDR family NAD(P)-dependent oxidoreductase n=1 Tax=Hydrogenophaga sp. TaxID=1904254 RepID=UPI002730960B
MIQDFKGKTAVLTGAGSGFGLECARIGAKLGMNLVLVDVQQDALDKATAEIEATGAKVLSRRVDVSSNEQMEALAADVEKTFGAPHFVFNNAGVGSGGLIWENSVKDWEWVLGVNLWGVIHGVRVFVPLMIEQGGPAHIVNTASMAGLISVPYLGAYIVSKHGAVTLSETLYRDLQLAGHSDIGVSVLCPGLVMTNIFESQRNRPDELADDGDPRGLSALLDVGDGGAATEDALGAFGQIL